MAPLTKPYLLAYNVAQCAGWAYILYKAVSCMATHGVGEAAASGALFAVTKNSLYIFQTAAVLEVVHAAVGLVRSNPFITAVQVQSRLFITWAIASQFVDAQNSFGYSLILVAWPVTEVIRYGYYALGLLGSNSSLVTWLRYTLFVILYPMGVTGELWCCMASIPAIKAENPFSVAMPNALNVTFSFHVALIGIVLSYIPFFPQLYLHMFSQRRKILGKSDKKAE